MGESPQGRVWGAGLRPCPQGEGHWPLTASAQNGRESTLVTLRWPEVTAAGDRSLPPAPGQGKEVESGGLSHKPEAGEAGCDPRARAP